MNWSTVWELTKINILYSNPQTLTALKKKQAKNPNARFQAYKAMIRQQIIMSIIFLFIYVFMFLGLNFNHYPGYFSFYVALFFVMSTLTAFTSLYTIFYESNDLKLYVHLPIKSSELYLAKFLSSLGMGSLFLMPLLSLFMIAYWQMLRSPLAILIALVLFIVIFISSNVLALYINSWIGKLIVRSPKRKLISTILMFFSSFGAIALILYLNFTNSTKMSETGLISDRSLVPYFRGYFDIVKEPISLASLLNFCLPLILILGMCYGILKIVMPRYYEEALYTSEQTKSRHKKLGKDVDFENTSLRKLLQKHHLLTLQNSSLLIQTYLMPLIFVVSFVMPFLTNTNHMADYVTPGYFGIAFLVGCVLAGICTNPNTFVGVGLSLERENLTYIKSLPLNLKRFVWEKYCFLIFYQTIVPIILYSLVSIFLFELNGLITLFMCLGYLSLSFIQGQIMYRRDVKYLNLRWQDMTQLFTRGGSQWFVAGLVFASMIFGGCLIGFCIFLCLMTKEVLLINSMIMILALSILLIVQYFIRKRFWNRLDRYFE